jgi:hypothetical protein
VKDAVFTETLIVNRSPDLMPRFVGGGEIRIRQGGGGCGGGGGGAGGGAVVVVTCSPSTPLAAMPGASLLRRRNSTAGKLDRGWHQNLHAAGPGTY